MNQIKVFLDSNTETTSLDLGVPTYLNDVSELLFTAQESKVIA